MPHSDVIGVPQKTWAAVEEDVWEWEHNCIEINCVQVGERKPKIKVKKEQKMLRREQIIVQPTTVYKWCNHRCKHFFKLCNQPQQLKQSNLVDNTCLQEAIKLVVVYKASTYCINHLNENFWIWSVWGFQYFLTVNNGSTTPHILRHTVYQPGKHRKLNQATGIQLMSTNATFYRVTKRCWLCICVWGWCIAIETWNTTPMTPFRVIYSLFHELNQHFDVGVCLHILFFKTCV